MTDARDPQDRPLHWRTRLIREVPQVRLGFHSLSSPVHRGSTVVFDRLADAVDDWRQAERYTYGLFGTPTTLELGSRIAALERAHHCFIVPGGLAAVALVCFAYCRVGSHALIPESVYGPTAALGADLLAGFGVEVERYDPLIGRDVARVIRPNTTLIWCESPGSITMEVQDVPAIVASAHERGVAVALDNTYAAGVLFDAFAHGVDVSVQALTKYVGGHSDLLLGSVSVAHDDAYEKVGRAYSQIGMNASPDDCSLALRGLKTLGVRLERFERSTLTVARWLKTRPEVAQVLHPGLPDCPGHEYWARDFTGSASVFSIVLGVDWTAARTERFVDALSLFKIGFSWGGASSLVMAYPGSARLGPRRERLVRFNVGLEEPDDLIADIAQALARA